MADTVPVRFAEGAVHGFLMLRTVNGSVLGPGDLLQVGRGGKVESRMVFHLKDGSVFDERVVFTQQRVFTMHTYSLVQRGPLFPEDTEITLERATGKYRLKTKARKGAREELLEGTLNLPPDVYNGMVLTIAKNLPKGGQHDRPHGGLHAKAQTHPAGASTVGTGQGAGRRTPQDCDPLRVPPPARALAQVLRQAARAHTTGLPRLDPHRRGAGLREVRGAALHDGADLADRPGLPDPRPRTRSLIAAVDLPLGTFLPRDLL